MDMGICRHCGTVVKFSAIDRYDVALPTCEGCGRKLQAEDVMVKGHIEFSPEDTPDSEIYLRSKIPATHIKEYMRILEDYQKDLYYADKELAEAKVQHATETEKARLDYNERIARMWAEIGEGSE
jgi:NAD-dependent SIR2 family protein deacetylase